MYASSLPGFRRIRFEYTWYGELVYSYTSGLVALLRPSDLIARAAPPSPDAYGSQFGKNTPCCDTVPSL